MPCDADEEYTNITSSSASFYSYTHHRLFLSPPFTTSSYNHDPHPPSSSLQVRKRALKKQRMKAKNKGFLDGMMEGGESIASGVSSGLSGLVSRPIEEAQKSGASGFFKGVGLGLLGAVVKPLMGVTDGVSAVANGISNQVTNEVVYTQVRPVRALDRIDSSRDVLAIKCMNVKAAYAKEFVVKRAKAQAYDDQFLSYVVINEETDESIILSETYIYWRKERSLWGRTWSNVSHCLFNGDAVSIVLYITNNGFGEVVHVPCYSREVAITVYDVLARNSYRMGNPRYVTLHPTPYLLYILHSDS